MITTLLFAVVDASSLPNSSADSNTISTIINIVFALAASIALLMVVIGGLRYTLAHGDSNSMSQAKNTIIYAIIGLVVTLAAYAMVTFVVRNIV